MISSNAIVKRVFLAMPELSTLKVRVCEVESQLPTFASPEGGEISARAELEGVDDPSSPVIVISATQLLSKGTLLVRSTVMVLGAQAANQTGHDHIVKYRLDLHQIIFRSMLCGAICG